MSLFPAIAASKPSTLEATPKKPLVLASRASKLAQIQTNYVLALLRAAHPSVEFTTSFTTNAEGDKDKINALYILGGKAIWTKELEVVLKEGEVDFLVHSFKDVPTVLPEGMIIAAVPERASPLDSFVVKKGKEKEWRNLNDLPDGSTVGTGSIRRIAQLRRTFPKLKFADVRGNVDTRLAKLDDPNGPFSALILAKAGLVRMKLHDRITSDITSPTLYHAVSQGALGVEIRSDDAYVKQLCEALIHWPTQWSCFAERACLRVLEGGCSVPVGVESILTPHGDGSEKKATLKLSGTVTSIDGSRHVEHSVEGEVASEQDAEELGVILAKTLISSGAKEILDEITQDRASRQGETKTVPEVERIEEAMQAQA